MPWDWNCQSGQLTYKGGHLWKFCHRNVKTGNKFKSLKAYPDSNKHAVHLLYRGFICTYLTILLHGFTLNLHHFRLVLPLLYGIHADWKSQAFLGFALDLCRILIRLVSQRKRCRKKWIKAIYGSMTRAEKLSGALMTLIVRVMYRSSAQNKCFSGSNVMVFTSSCAPRNYKLKGYW